MSIRSNGQRGVWLGSLCSIVLMVLLLGCALLFAPSLIAQLIFGLLGLAALLLQVALYTYLNQQSQKHAQEATRWRKQLHEASKYLDERDAVRSLFKGLLNVVYEGVLYSEQGQIRQVNRALVALLGYTVEDLQRRDSPSAREVVALHDLVLREMRGGGLWRGVYKLHNREGYEFDVAVTATAVEKGQVFITLRETNHEKVFQWQRSRFITNTSHELKTPLGTLKQQLYLLRRQPAHQEEHWQKIDGITAYMSRLLDDMLDVVRFERGMMLLNRSEAALQEVINEVVQGMANKARARDVDLRYECNAEQEIVFIDRARISQVVTNLITNALNHVSDHGDIQVSVYRSADLQAVVEVRDNGRAIPAEALDVIFQPFADASQGAVTGTVLGLSLSKEIIQLHGGEIHVESGENKGTVVRFTLPLLPL